MRKKGAELVFLGELPDGEEVIDFYHAAGHLDTALAAAYGDTHPKRRAQFEKQRHVLLEDYKGVEKVIRSLVHLRDTYPRRKKIARELKYFRRNRHRMRYAALKEQGLPIGSGVTEAACKTLATQRMKRSGMRWGEQGGQAILSFRALVQSNRFERAWTLLAHTYKAEVTTLDNVVRYAVGNDRCQYESYTQRNDPPQESTKRPRESPQETLSRLGPYPRYPPFASLRGGPRMARLRSGPPPPGADKEASHLF